MSRSDQSCPVQVSFSCGAPPLFKLTFGFQPIDLVIIVKWPGFPDHAEIRREEKDPGPLAEKVRCDGGWPEATPAANVRLFVTFYSSIKGYLLQPQIRKSWDSMENANKKRK